MREAQRRANSVGVVAAAAAAASSMAHIIAHIFIVYPAVAVYVQWGRLDQQFISLS